MKVLLNIPEKTVDLATALLAHELDSDEMEIVKKALEEQGDTPIEFNATDIEEFGERDANQLNLAICALALRFLNIKDDE